MGKVEKFINEHIRYDSNIAFDASVGYVPWLTSDDARKAVEIAKEEIYELLRKVSFDDYKIPDEESYKMGCPYDYIDVDRLIDDFKQAMTK